MSSRVAISFHLNRSVTYRLHHGLEPRLGLHAVRQAMRSIPEGNSADEALQAIRPVCVRCKHAQYGPAEELAACPDLRRDGKFAEPAVVLSVSAVCVIEPTLKCKREILRKENLWPRANRYPVVPTVSWISVLRPLICNDRHDREPVIWLNEEMFGDAESSRTLEERRRVVDRRTKVAGHSCSVL